MAYSFYRTITIDHTKVPNTDQSNFPVLVSGTYTYLKTTGNGGSVSNSNGYDIVFSSDSAGLTLLNWEIEFYDPATGIVVFWVSVPTVSHTTDTVIYMSYGNAAISTFQGGTAGAAWDTNYKGVWHFPDGTSLGLLDSTTTGGNGTNSSATATAGKIDGAISISGSQYASVADATAFRPSVVTLECWVKSNSIPVGGSYIFHKLWNSSFGSSYALYTAGNQTDIYFYVMDSGGSFTRSPASGTIWDNNWHHVVGTWDGTSAELFVDGVSKGATSNARTIAYAANPIYFGTFDTTNDPYSGGLIDEARVSSSVRSADWISTSYANQNSPATFYTIGAQVGASTSLIFNGIQTHAVGYKQLIIESL